MGRGEDRKGHDIRTKKGTSPRLLRGQGEGGRSRRCRGVVKGRPCEGRERNTTLKEAVKTIYGFSGRLRIGKELGQKDECYVAGGVWGWRPLVRPSVSLYIYQSFCRSLYVGQCIVWCEAQKKKNKIK